MCGDNLLLSRDRNSTFTGHVAINATFVVPTTSIVLQSLGLDIGAVRVSHSGQDVQVDSVFLYPEVTAGKTPTPLPLPLSSPLSVPPRLC